METLKDENNVCKRLKGLFVVITLINSASTAWHKRVCSYSFITSASSSLISICCAWLKCELVCCGGISFFFFFFFTAETHSCKLCHDSDGQVSGVESSWAWKEKLLRRWGRRGNEAAFQQWFMKCLSFSLYFWLVCSCSRQFPTLGELDPLTMCIERKPLVTI